MCEGLGLDKVRTYIQSGNVIFESALSEKAARGRLEELLAKRMGKKMDVMVRTATELRAILDANPFPDAAPAKVSVIFMSGPVPKDVLKDATAPGGEKLGAGKRELYIYYPEGMGRSKLKIPRLKESGTARNINTVGKLVALATK